MANELSEQKAALRSQVRAAIKNLTPAARAGAAARARSLLQQQMIWNQARSVLFFAPLPDELDIWPLLQESLATGKTVALPRFSPFNNNYAACRIRDLRADVQTGKFGIREPADTCEPLLQGGPDLVLVPGIAFDWQGRRLGRGQGFYDKLLSTARGAKCAVAFDEQIVAEVPVEPHDIRVGYILTPTRWVEVHGGRKAVTAPSKPPPR